MFSKLIGLATLPIDIVKDVATLGGELTDEKSATKEKLDYLTGQEEFKREQDRKDIETLSKAVSEILRSK